MSLPAKIIRNRRARRRKLSSSPDDARGRGIPAALDPEAPEAAATGLTTPRYPALLDEVPTITSNVTPLSGIFHNYLALMLESLMAELGPFPEMGQSLMDYLGVQFANSVSNWRSVQKSSGGNEAGQVYGFIKRFHSATAVGYSSQQTSSARNLQGHHPSGKQPALFAEVVGGLGITAQQMVDGIGGGIRGEVIGILGTNIQYNYRGCPADSTPGAPVGSHVQTANILLAYLVEAP